MPLASEGEIRLIRVAARRPLHFLGSACTRCTGLEKAFSERALRGDRAALAIDKNALCLPVLPSLEGTPGTSPSTDTAAPESTIVALPVALGESECGVQGEEGEGSSRSTAKMLSVGDLALFLAEQRRTIAAICASIDAASLRTRMPGRSSRARPATSSLPAQRCGWC